MATAVQPLLKVKRGPLKVGKAPLFDLDGALAHKTRASPLTRGLPFSFLSRGGLKRPPRRVPLVSLQHKLFITGALSPR